MGSAVETKGSCLCGDIQYRFTTQPSYTCLCHCLGCRKVSGGTNSTIVPIPRADLFIDNESTLKQSQSIKHHASDVTMIIHFCGSCGTSIFKEASTAPGMVILFMGTIDDEGELIGELPTAEIWTQYRVSWNGELKGARQCEGWDVAK